MARRERGSSARAVVRLKLQCSCQSVPLAASRRRGLNNLKLTISTRESFSATPIIFGYALASRRFGLVAGFINSLVGIARCLLTPVVFRFGVSAIFARSVK